MLISAVIPHNEYYEYYGPDYELDVRPSNMTDHNSPEYLDKLREVVFDILRDQNAAPSVQMQGGWTSRNLRSMLTLMQRYQSWHTTTRMGTRMRIWKIRMIGDQVSYDGSMSRFS